jgi:hypothetical protein
LPATVHLNDYLWLLDPRILWESHFKNHIWNMLDDN